ncbi:MAG: protease HtpX [Succinivibrio sp.]|jgi:heat shock protein HtpX|nr:protease HtpX [Succinivibrio sp.]
MRIFLFMLMQSAILVVVGFIGFIVMSAFDIQLDQNSYISMFVGSLIFGFAGSLISLFLSKTMCIKSYGVKLIKTPMNSDEMFIYQTVSNLALKSGLKMPEVGIYNSSDPNAFATGYSKDKALVAVSSGLLRSMGRTEIAAVLGHEMSHVKNGDMVTMALLQGVLNTFVYFFSYVIAFAIIAAMNKNRKSGSSTSMSSSIMYRTISSFIQMILGVLASLVLMWFSRHREYKADAGSARLNGKYEMIRALQALSGGSPVKSKDKYMQALCINGSMDFSELFRTHPPIEKRIKALEDLIL